MAKRHRLRKSKVEWTDRGRTEGRVKVETAERRTLNTLNREHGRQNVKGEKELYRPVMVENPGVQVKVPRYKRAPTVTLATMETVVPLLRPGQAFKLKTALEFDMHSSEDYPFQIAAEHYPREWDNEYDVNKETIARKGAMALYLGAQRIDERMSKGDIVRQHRHLFVVGSGRYVILDLNLLEPL